MSPRQRTAVLLDPHPLWLEAVQAVLASLDIGVAGKATTAEQALEMIDRHEPDLLLAETGLTGAMSGVSLVREARQRVPLLRVIAVAGSADPSDIAAVFDAGALAYVVKTARPDDVAATVRQAFEPSIFHARIQSPGVSPTPGPDGAVRDDEGAALTRREREILALVAEGRSNRELAGTLWVTEQTVKFHLSNIYRKLKLSNRTEASHWAHKHRLLDTTEALPT